MKFAAAMVMLVKTPGAHVALHAWSEGTYCYMGTNGTVQCIDANNKSQGPYTPHVTDITGIWERRK